jgi:hypothetical protein
LLPAAEKVVNGMIQMEVTQEETVDLADLAVLEQMPHLMHQDLEMLVEMIPDVIQLVKEIMVVIQDLRQVIGLLAEVEVRGLMEILKLVMIKEVLEEQDYHLVLMDLQLLVVVVAAVEEGLLRQAKVLEGPVVEVLEVVEIPQETLEAMVQQILAVVEVAVAIMQAVLVVLESLLSLMSYNKYRCISLI